MKAIKNIPLKIPVFTLIIVLMITGISATNSPDSSEIHIEKELYNRNAILLRNAQFDTASMQSYVVSADNLSKSQYPGDTDGYYIVQFTGSIREEWKQAVRNTGADIFD